MAVPAPCNTREKPNTGQPRDPIPKATRLNRRHHKQLSTKPRPLHGEVASLQLAPVPPTCEPKRAVACRCPSSGTPADTLVATGFPGPGNMAGSQPERSGPPNDCERWPGPPVGEPFGARCSLPPRAQQGVPAGERVKGSPRPPRGAPLTRPPPPGLDRDAGEGDGWAQDPDAVHAERSYRKRVERPEAAAKATTRDREGSASQPRRVRNSRSRPPIQPRCFQRRRVAALTRSGRCRTSPDRAACAVPRTR